MWSGSSGPTDLPRLHRGLITLARARHAGNRNTLKKKPQMKSLAAALPVLDSYWVETGDDWDVCLQGLEA